MGATSKIHFTVLFITKHSFIEMEEAKKLFIWGAIPEKELTTAIHVKTVTYKGFSMIWGGPKVVKEQSFEYIFFWLLSWFVAAATCSNPRLHDFNLLISCHAIETDSAVMWDEQRN